LDVLRRFGQITPAEYEVRRQAILDESPERRPDPDGRPSDG
jgi:hypothetical protein